MFNSPVGSGNEEEAENAMRVIPRRYVDRGSNLSSLSSSVRILRESRIEPSFVSRKNKTHDLAYHVPKMIGKEQEFCSHPACIVVRSRLDQTSSHTAFSVTLLSYNKRSNIFMFTHILCSFVVDLASYLSNRTLFRKEKKR